MSTLVENNSEEKDSSLDSNLNKASEELQTYLTKELGYQRIDHEILSQFSQTQLEKNAIHGTLSGYSMIAKYHVYHKEGENNLYCIVEIGDKLAGHPEIVHGGIISAIFDNTFGWLYMVTKQKSAFTANLNINFRKPLYVNSVGLIKATMDKVEVSFPNPLQILFSPIFCFSIFFV
jgi:acyl-coenzyme A thioesterase PaaI-like protein